MPAQAVLLLRLIVEECEALAPEPEPPVELPVPAADDLVEPVPREVVPGGVITGEVVRGGVITREGVYGRRSSIGAASDAANTGGLRPRRAAYGQGGRPVA